MVSTPAWHYREAERLVQLSLRQRERDKPEDHAPLSQLTMLQAQVHATLAAAGATIEAADADANRDYLVKRPYPAADGDPAMPGTEWGRAFYGDRHLETGDET